jgi:hypothetical protein
VPLSNVYPLFFALAGFVVAALLSQRALVFMDPGAKAALIDALSRTRLLTLLVLAVFLMLVLWRPLLGWTYLGFAYLGLGARSLLRLRRLNLPPRSARLIFIGNMTAVVGIALCVYFRAESTTLTPFNSGWTAP